MKVSCINGKQRKAILASRVLGALVLGGLWSVTAFGNSVDARDYSNLQDLGKVTLVEEKKSQL